MTTADPQLTTERLDLAPLAPGDALALHELFTRPEVRRHLWDDLAIDDVDTDNVVRQSLRSFRANRYGLWRVQRRGAPGLVGCCGLREVGRDAELVVAVDPACHRQGYGREAGRAVLAYALRRLRLPRVVALCDVGNEAARGLATGLGMRESHVSSAKALGRTVDVVVYEATAADLPFPQPVVAPR